MIGMPKEKETLPKDNDITFVDIDKEAMFIIQALVIAGLIITILYGAYFVWDTNFRTKIIECEDKSYAVHEKYLGENSFLYYQKRHSLDGCEVWDTK